MGCQSGLLRETRLRHGLSQRRLALRAGTSQDAISRIERGAEQPTAERLDSLLAVMGERLVLSSQPASERERPTDGLTAAERLREAASWNLVAMRLENAAAETRAH